MCTRCLRVMKHFCVILPWIWGTCPTSQCRYVDGDVSAGSCIRRLLFSSPLVYHISGDHKYHFKDFVLLRFFGKNNFFSFRERDDITFPRDCMVSLWKINGLCQNIIMIYFSSSLQWTIFLSFCSFLYSGVCYNVLKLSVTLYFHKCMCKRWTVSVRA